MKKVNGLLLLTTGLLSVYANSVEWRNTESSQRALVGPRFTDNPQQPDFIVNFGHLNNHYYNYQSSQDYLGCVLETPYFSFGTEDSTSTLVDLKVFALVDWSGSNNKFKRLNSFEVNFEGTYRPTGCSNDSCIEEFSENQAVSVRSLPNNQIIGSEVFASTNNEFVWFPFNHFSVDGMIVEGRLRVCNVESNQTLFIAAFDLRLSHEAN